MLTSLQKKTKFKPAMFMRSKRLILLLMLGLFLQSCYTVIHPPETLPMSVTTITSEPAMASSLIGSGLYGWDPYWEPVLPFTNYNRGYGTAYYGSSYYSPYNYYDYQHSYYEPIYVESEGSTPVAGRSYGRDSQRSASRSRETRTPDSSQNTPVLSTARPTTSTPASTTPIVSSRKKSSSSKSTTARTVNRGTKRVRKETPKAEKQDSKTTEQEPPKKRKRTKK